MCQFFLQLHFQGRYYLNKDTGVAILVSSDGVRQWVTKSRSREKIIIIQILDFLLENDVNHKFYYCSLEANGK